MNAGSAWLPGPLDQRLGHTLDQVILRIVRAPGSP
jgi:hypothetical protein